MLFVASVAPEASFVVVEFVAGQSAEYILVLTASEVLESNAQWGVFGVVDTEAAVGIVVASRKALGGYEMSIRGACTGLSQEPVRLYVEADILKPPVGQAAL